MTLWILVFHIIGAFSIECALQAMVVLQWLRTFVRVAQLEFIHADLPRCMI